LARERFCLEVESYTRILLHQPVDDGPDKSCRNCIRAPDPELSCGRIGQESDLVNALFQLIEDGNAAFDEGSTILCWLNASRTTVEEPHAMMVRFAAP
jgi:hypothetical protein